MKKRAVRVLELQDFICRCGAHDFSIDPEHSPPQSMTCSACGREYRIRKLEKRTPISNLPMSFGFRSLYWDKIEVDRQGIAGVSGESYEITEREGAEA